MKQFARFVNSKLYPFFVFTILIAALFIWKSALRVESAKQNIEDNQIENYDIRTDKYEPAQKAIEKFIRESGKDALLISSEKRNARKTAAELKANKRWTIEYNQDIRTPEVISAEIGTNANLLTTSSNEKRDKILRRFLNENSALFGLDESQIGELETTADYTNPNGVLSFVHLAQRSGGVPVFRGEVKAGFNKRGEMFRVINNLAPALDYQNLNTDFGNAEQAVISAAKNIGWTVNDLKRIEAASDNLKITFERGQFADQTVAEKIYFPVRYGAARPAWRVLLWTETEAFYVIVDAQDGTLLWRKNLTEHQTLPATFNVYGNTTSMMQTEDSPAPATPGCPMPTICPQPPLIARQNFTLVGNEPPYTFNDLGWIPDTGLPVRTPADPNVTDGNNVEAGLDRVTPDGVDAPVPGNPFRVFNFIYNPSPGDPPPGEDPLSPEYQKGSVTQLFYTVNRWHDEMYLLGFTEQAGNFQHFNFGRGGVEGDRVSAQAQDSSGTNGASMTVPGDGTRPRLQMMIWTGSDPDRDGALDAQVVVHEATHGVSGRLHNNGNGLTTNMSRGMGEGWSDFYALALLSEPTDDPCGTYAVGGYITYQVVSGFEGNYYYGIRRFPTSRINCLGPNGRPHNPLTFRHVNSNCNADINTIGAFPRGPIGSATCDQVHNLGDVWSAMLWEVRGVLIDQHGATEGNRRALQYITDGMKLAPIGPTFLQERDAIIAAAFATNPADVKWVREGFRRRGLGFSASIQNAGTGANNTVVTEAFDLPNIQIINPFSVSDVPGDNDGFPEAGEKVFLNVTVTNQTGEVMNNAFVNANGGTNVNLGTIANGQTVQTQILFKIPRNIPCGSANYQVTLNAGSDVGVQIPVLKQFRVGVPVSGPPVEFTNATPIDMPNGQPANTSGPFAPYPSNITVSGLTGNKIMKVKLNGYHHEFEDDLDFLLVGPGGQKYIFMSDVGGTTELFTPITFTVADTGDTLLPDATGIMNGVTYKPSNVGANDPFDAPAPGTPYSNAAPGGADTFASVFGTDGAALNGTWSLYGDDDAGSDPGRMDGGWTLIFEADDYVCAFIPNSPRADFDGDGKTDMSVFRPTEGNWYLNRSASGFTAINWGLSGDVLVPGDYDGDNMTDTAIKRGGDWYILRSCDNTVAVVNWGLSTDIAVAGDYDGDLKTDYAVFRPSEGNWYVLRSDGGNVIFNWGLSTDIPLAGDFDGDGKTDFTVYRNGVWYINGSASGVKIVTFGLSSDMPVHADYDGDGKDDIAVFRPSDGYWYIWRSSDEGVSYIPFGLNGDIPVPGDYDGDGKYDQAVYRNGIWYLNQSTNGFSAAQFGLAADQPIPKAYIP